MTDATQKRHRKPRPKSPMEEATELLRVQNMELLDLHDQLKCAKIENSRLLDANETLRKERDRAMHYIRALARQIDARVGDALGDLPF